MTKPLRGLCAAVGPPRKRGARRKGTEFGHLTPEMNSGYALFREIVDFVNNLRAVDKVNSPVFVTGACLYTLRLCAMHWATMLTAISSGVSALMGRPTGQCTRASSVAVTP